MNSNPRSVHLTGAASLAALAAGACLFSAAPASAQTPAAPRTADQSAAQTGASGAEAEIIVTAQFRAQNIQDTPLAITALNAEQLEQRNISTLAGLSAIAPNVNLQAASSTFGPATAAFIRGVGQYDTNFALEPGVGIYVDDVYFSTLHGSMLDLLDLQRVEVLRGPQGTLAGQNSIGGAVRLYSRRPGEGGSYLQAGYGSYNRVEIRGAADMTLVDNLLYARISGASLSQDGFIDRYDYRCTHPSSAVPSYMNGANCHLGTEGGKAYTGGRIALRFTPGDRFELNVAGDYTNDSSEAGPSTLLYVGTVAAPGITGTPAQIAPYQVNGVLLGTATGSEFVSYSPFGGAQDTFSSSPYTSYENYLNYAPRDGTAPYAGDPVSQVDAWGISANAVYHLSDDFALTSITAYRRFSGDYTTAEGSPINTTLQINHTDHWQFSQEVRFNGSFADFVDFTIGAYYFKANSAYQARISLPTLEFREADRIPAETKALFATADFRLTDALHLIGGIRYTDLSKTFTYGRLGNPGSNIGGATPPAVAPLDGLTNTFGATRTDYRAAVQYRWTPNFMTYAEYATGFKGGGINPRPFFPAQALSHNPETLDAYEIGFKSDFFDHRLRLNAAAFLNQYDDIVMTVQSCPALGSPCALPINAGQADVSGAELEASIFPIDGLTINASVGYTDFQYTSISASAASAGITLDMVGPFVQKLQYSLGAQYEMELGALGTLTPRIDFNHQDSFFTSAINRAPFNVVPERDLINARLTYESPEHDWQAALAITNLADEVYYEGIFDNRGSTRTVQGRPGAPREYTVSIRRNF